MDLEKIKTTNAENFLQTHEIQIRLNGHTLVKIPLYSALLMQKLLGEGEGKAYDISGLQIHFAECPRGNYDDET